MSVNQTNHRVSLSTSDVLKPKIKLFFLKHRNLNKLDILTDLNFELEHIPSEYPHYPILGTY